MIITNKIKALMKINNITQNDLALKLDTTQANISRILKLGNSIRIEDLLEIVNSAGAAVEINIVLPDGTKF